MPLNIRDPRATELAKELATLRGVTMTTAVIEALEKEIARERHKEPLRDRLARLSAKAHAIAGPNGRPVTEEERDEMWRR